MAEPQGPKLSTIFEEIWKNYQDLESTSEPMGSDNVQTKVKKTKEIIEQGIQIVNDLSLFSQNEDIEEVATTEIKYLLLPALLGYFTGKITTEDRYTTVKAAKTYFIEFLRLCKYYSLTNIELPTTDNDHNKELSKTSQSRNLKSDMKSMADRRHAKIQKYKEEKETEARLKDLYAAIQKEHVDENVKRDYYLTLIKQWIHKSQEDIDSIDTELPILEHMSQMKKNGEKAPDKPEDRPQKQKVPFRPFILTRDQVQAQVFGAGYPSIPTYTVEQWYDQQVAAGRMPGPEEARKMQQESTDTEKAARESEKQDLEKEEKLEKDDEETLRKAREWDDWKDDHRRGWGNRQNMG